MIFSKKTSPFLCLALTCSLLVGLCVSASGQGRSVQRLEGKLDRRVVDLQGDRASSTKKGLDISLVTSLAYDDNIFQSPDETESVVVRFEPTIGWTVGSREGSWLRLAYEGAAVAFLSSEEDNRIDYRIAAEGGVKGKSLALAYSANWARIGNPSADFGGESDRDEWGVDVGVIYSPKGKLSYSAFADLSAVEQSDSSFFDLYQSSGGLTANYRHSSKTEVEAAYRVGRIDVDGSGSQSLQRLTVQALWRPRSKLSVSLEAGLEHRSYEVGSNTNPYLSARVDWRPRAKTAFYLEAYRREEASGAVEGENFSLLGVRAGVNQRLKGGWSAGLEVGRERADYFSITSAPDSGREDTISFFRPSLSYAFNEDTEIVLLYQWTENDSSDALFGFENQQLGISMNYSF